MDEKIPEPLSKPVEPTKPGANIPPAPAAPNATVSSTPMGMPASNVGKSGGGKKVLVVAFGTIFMMGITSRTPKSFVPYSHRWGEVPRLSIRPNEATWRTGSSFLAVLDADNPSS